MFIVWLLGRGISSVASRVLSCFEELKLTWFVTGWRRLTWINGSTWWERWERTDGQTRSSGK